MSQKCNEENLGRIKSIIKGTKKFKTKRKNVVAYCNYLRSKEKQPNH